jgi:hypothetical protein
MFLACDACFAHTDRTYSKWRMFLIYAALMVIAEVITYMYIPETKGLPMEEIGALFGDEVVVHLTADGQGIIEDKQVTDHIEDNGFVQTDEKQVHHEERAGGESRNWAPIV